MMMFVELTGPRRKRLEVALDTDALPKLGEFLRGFASRAGWNADLTEERLVLVGEETLASLLSEEGDEVERGEGTAAGCHGPAPTGARRSWSSCRRREGENLEDRLAYLGETPDLPDVQEISFRLLRHYASSVRHQKYHGVDIVTVRVDGPTGHKGHR